MITKIETFRSGITSVEQKSSGSISLHLVAFITVKVGWLRYCVRMYGICHSFSVHFFTFGCCLAQVKWSRVCLHKVPNLRKCSQFPTGDTIILYIYDFGSTKTNTSALHLFCFGWSSWAWLPLINIDMVGNDTTISFNSIYIQRHRHFYSSHVTNFFSLEFFSIIQWIFSHPIHYLLHAIFRCWKMASRRYREMLSLLVRFLWVFCFFL